MKSWRFARGHYPRYISKESCNQTAPMDPISSSVWPNSSKEPLFWLTITGCAVSCSDRVSLKTHSECLKLSRCKRQAQARNPPLNTAHLPEDSKKSPMLTLTALMLWNRKASTKTMTSVLTKMMTLCITRAASSTMKSSISPQEARLTNRSNAKDLGFIEWTFSRAIRTSWRTRRRSTSSTGSTGRTTRSARFTSTTKPLPSVSTSRASLLSRWQTGGTVRSQWSQRFPCEMPS